MAFQTLRAREPAGHGGLIRALLALANDFGALAESRFALFVRESKSALVQVIVLAACLILDLDRSYRCRGAFPPCPGGSSVRAAQNV
jgi:hypothetical protein